MNGPIVDREDVSVDGAASNQSLFESHRAQTSVFLVIFVSGKMKLTFDISMIVVGRSEESAS
jgi:hypothetical protein